MESYKCIKADENDTNGETGRDKWKPFWRQLFVCSGVWMVHFLTGLSVGAPTIFIHQLRKEFNSTDAVSDEMASWLSSAYAYSALPWICILSILAHYIGRKKTYSIISINSIFIYTVFYCSRNTTHLLITTILCGIFHASTLTLSIIIVTEYTSPKYRGLFFTIKSATIFWGIWVSNAIGCFFHWRSIALVGLVCSFYTLTIFSWPESPFWLALKGRSDQSKKAHYWLRGYKKSSLEDLDILLKYPTKDETRRKMFSKENMQLVHEIIRWKSFYKQILLAVLIIAQYNLSGKAVCTMYAIDIIKKITMNESATYIGMLVLDGVTVLSMYFGCVLTKVLKRRTLFFTSSSVAILFLFILSMYLYLVRSSVLIENNFVSVALLAGFSIAFSCGPLIMCSCLCGELIPIQYKSLSVIIISLSFNIMIGTLLKVSPYIFTIFGLDGAFLFFAITSLFCTIILYIFLPETKDKTAHEITELLDGN